MTDGKAQRPEGSAQREARSEHIPTPEGQGGGEAMEEAREIVNFNPLHDGDFDDEWAEKAQRVAHALLSSPRVEGLSHADLCRLSRCFLTDYRSAQDQRINEWLQRQIASALSLQVG